MGKGRGKMNVEMEMKAHETQQLKITFENELQLVHNFIASVPSFAS